MSAHVPGFQSFLMIVASICIGQISHRQHKGLPIHACSSQKKKTGFFYNKIICKKNTFTFYIFLLNFPHPLGSFIITYNLLKGTVWVLNSIDQKYSLIDAVAFYIYEATPI